MRVISNFILQYTNSNFASLSSSPFDLVITEGAPLPRAGSAPQISDSQVQSLQAQGRTVVGYINAAVTDTFRSYWNTAWTVNGDDRGALTANAPAWLQNGVPNAFGRIVDIADAAWQLIVINQAKDLVSRGYSGVFIDDVAAYFALGQPGGEAAIRARATQMANLVARVAAEIRAINPDAYVVVNSNPFLPGDVTLDANVPVLPAEMNVFAY